MHVHIEGNRNFQQRMTLNFTIKYKAIITLSVTRWMVDLLYTKVCHFSNKYHNGLKSPLLWNVCIIRLPRSNLILQKTIEIFLVRDTVLNARINSFYSFYFTWKEPYWPGEQIYDNERDFSRLSWSEKNLHTVYYLLLADVFVKNHSKNNPSWFSYMFYNNVKLLSNTRTLNSYTHLHWHNTQKSIVYLSSGFT